MGCDAVHKDGIDFEFVYFNPRTPYGVRPYHFASPFGRKPRISIHAPRMGCDRRMITLPMGFDLQFQSTHPVWGATFNWYFCLACRWRLISIHAPRMGCDLMSVAFIQNFLRLFQSTHPVWGATADKKIPD